MSYVYSGDYYWDTGRLYSQTLNGLYWSSSIVSSTNSYRLNMHSTRLITANSNNKRVGCALRYVTVPRFFLSTGSLGVRSYPLSYVNSGIYYWATGRLYHQSVDGYYWSSSIVSSIDSYGLVMYNKRLIMAYSTNKRFGVAMRCVFA